MFRGLVGGVLWGIVLSGAVLAVLSQVGSPPTGGALVPPAVEEPVAVAVARQEAEAQAADVPAEGGGAPVALAESAETAREPDAVAPGAPADEALAVAGAGGDASAIPPPPAGEKSADAVARPDPSVDATTGDATTVDAAAPPPDQGGAPETAQARDATVAALADQPRPGETIAAPSGAEAPGPSGLEGEKAASATPQAASATGAPGTAASGAEPLAEAAADTGATDGTDAETDLAAAALSPVPPRPAIDEPMPAAAPEAPPVVAEAPRAAWGPPSPATLPEIPAAAAPDAAPAPVAPLPRPDLPEPPAPGDAAVGETDLPAAPAASPPAQTPGVPPPPGEAVADAPPPAAAPAPAAPGGNANPRPSRLQPDAALGKVALAPRADRLPRIIGPAAQPAPAPEAPAVTEEAAAADDRPAIDRHARAFDNPAGKPLLAIVLIDGGDPALDRRAMAALPFPVTFLLDPSRPESALAASIYREGGQEVAMLATGLPAGATASDLEVTFAAYADVLPEAVAIVDPEAGGFQGDRAVATMVVPIVSGQGRGLLSWDRGLNAAEQVARRQGLRSGVIYRRLDGAGEDAAMMRRVLDRAAFKAAQNGRVIVAGEARPETVAALLEWTVEGRATTVALAPLSAALVVE